MHQSGTWSVCVMTLHGAWQSRIESKFRTKASQAVSTSVYENIICYWKFRTSCANNSSLSPEYFLAFILTLPLSILNFFVRSKNYIMIWIIMWTDFMFTVQVNVVHAEAIYSTRITVQCMASVYLNEIGQYMPFKKIMVKFGMSFLLLPTLYIDISE